MLPSSALFTVDSLPLGSIMEKLQLREQNLGQVFNLRSGHLHAAKFLLLSIKLPNLQLKTRAQTTARFSPPISYRAPLFNQPARKLEMCC